MGKPFVLQRLICINLCNFKELDFPHLHPDAGGDWGCLWSCDLGRSSLYLQWDVTHAEFARVCLLWSGKATGIGDLKEREDEVGSYGAIVDLRESTKSISFCLRALVQCLQYTCNLGIVLDGMRMQHMSMPWNFNFVWRLTLDPPSWQNHWFVSAWPYCTKPMLVFHNSCHF